MNSGKGAERAQVNEGAERREFSKVMGTAFHGCHYRSL